MYCVIYLKSGKFIECELSQDTIDYLVSAMELKAHNTVLISDDTNKKYLLKIDSIEYITWDD